MRRALGIAVLGFLAAGPGAARVLHVPAGYATIASALANAAAPDTVQLACGTYFEHRLRLPAGVTLSGEPDSHCVVIDGTGSTTQGILQFLGLSAESTVRWVTFRNGRSHYGGAISLGGPLPAPGPLIEHCRFESNTANYVGGAVHISSGPLRIDSCEFDDNVAEDGGGAVHAGEVAVSHCTFRRNRSTDGWGGALGASDGEVVHSTFEDNIAARSGGGISSWRVSIRDCTFRRNQAIWGGGASTSRTVERCLFEANTATHGGGLEASDEGSTRVVQCRFVENVATSAAGLQAVGAVIVGSCTFLLNEAQSAAGCGGGASLQNVVIQDSRVGGAYGGSASLWNCNFHGNAGGDWVGGAATYRDLNGNFSADGLFATVRRSRSPCRRSRRCSPRTTPPAWRSGRRARAAPPREQRSSRHPRVSRWWSMGPPSRRRPSSRGRPGPCTSWRRRSRWRRKRACDSTSWSGRMAAIPCAR